MPASTPQSERMEQHLVNVTFRRSDSKANMCTSFRVLCANPLERAPNVWPGSSLVINCWGPISAHAVTLLVYSTSNSAMRKSRPYWGLESILTGAGARHCRGMNVWIWLQFGSDIMHVFVHVICIPQVAAPIKFRSQPVSAWEEHSCEICCHSKFI